MARTPTAGALPVVAAVLLSVGGCLDFGWESGQFTCGTDGRCPEGFHCDQGLCVAGAPPATDADTDADADADADADTDTDTDADADADADTDTDTDADADADADADTDADTDTGTDVCAFADCPASGGCGAGLCEPGTDDSYSCSVVPDAGLCAAPECGTVECSGAPAYDCAYGPDDADCQPAGDCDLGLCLEPGDGPPPACHWMVDWHACEAGQSCDPGAGYGCQAGLCDGGLAGAEVRLTTLAGQSVNPSVVATDEGFAAVWIDDISANYGDIHFALFDPAGALLSAEAKTTLGEYNMPTLLWLGPGEGYAVVFQRYLWASSNTHEVFLALLDGAGDVGTEVQVSDTAASHSRYPAAGIGRFGEDVRVAVVWSDARGGNHDVYARVYDPENLVFTGADTLVGGSTGDDYWPRVAATSAGFVAAYHHTVGDEQVHTRLFDPEGAMLAESVPVTPPLVASLPVALASDGAGRLAAAWRDVRLPGKSVVFFRPLAATGAPLGGLDGGIGIGDALEENLVPAPFKSRFALAWDPGGAAWAMAFDSAGSDPFGYQSAEILVTRIAEDGQRFDAAFGLSHDPGRSVRPALAAGAVGLVLWHDGRDESALDPDWGEIYSAALECP